MMYRYLLFFIVCLSSLERIQAQDEAPIQNAKEFNRALVSLTFDDGFLSAYEEALPLLEHYQIPATFYITTGHLELSDYLTVQQMLALKQGGHEIGSHCLTHRSLTTMNRSDIFKEVLESKVLLENLLGTPVISFAPPYGAFDTRVLTFVRKCYQSNRSIASGFNVKNRFNSYSLKVQNVGGSTTPAQVEAWLDQTIQDKSWLILVYHRIEDNLGDYTTLPSDLKAHLTAIKSRELATVTVEEALKEIKPQLKKKVVSSQ